MGHIRIFNQLLLKSLEVLSKPFPFYLLSATAVEPLAISVHQFSVIKGIIIKDHHFKLSLNADDWFYSWVILKNPVMC